MRARVVRLLGASSLPVMLICAATAHGQVPGPHAADSLYIKQGESDWAASMVKHNPRALERILADDFIEVADSGKLYSRAGAIGYHPTDFLSNQIDSLSIRFYGDVAIAYGSESWAKKDGSAGRDLWTDTWVRRRGKWQIVASAGQAAIRLK